MKLNLMVFDKFQSNTDIDFIAKREDCMLIFRETRHFGPLFFTAVQIDLFSELASLG